VAKAYSTCGRSLHNSPEYPQQVGCHHSHVQLASRIGRMVICPPIAVRVQSPLSETPSVESSLYHQCVRSNDVSLEPLTVRTNRPARRRSLEESNAWYKSDSRCVEIPALPGVGCLALPDHDTAFQRAGHLLAPHGHARRLVHVGKLAADARSRLERLGEHRQRGNLADRRRHGPGQFPVSRPGHQRQRHAPGQRRDARFQHHVRGL